MHKNFKAQKLKRSILNWHILILTMVLSCSSEKDRAKIESIKFEPLVELVRKGSLVIPIDSVTPPNVTSFQYYQDGTDGYFSFINVFNNSIYHFNIDRNEFAKRDTFSIEGPNGVGQFRNTSEFVFLGDSIILYDRRSKRLTILDEKKDVVFKHLFGMKTTQSPYGMFGDWLIFENEKFDLTTSAVSLSFLEINDLPDSLDFVFDPKTREGKRSYLPLPDEYEGKKWLTEHLRYYRAFDSTRNRRVYSFPINDHVLVKDNFGELSYKYLGASFLSDIEPLKNLDIARNTERKMKYFFGQGGYGKMYYDPYRDIYLRYAISGINEYKLDLNDPFNDTTAYTKSLILANGNVEKIGEFRSNSFNQSVIFFRPDGIYIKRISEDEDHIIFDIFELREL